MQKEILIPGCFLALYLVWGEKKKNNTALSSLENSYMCSNFIKSMREDKRIKEEMHL